MGITWATQDGRDPVMSTRSAPRSFFAALFACLLAPPLAAAPPAGGPLNFRTPANLDLANRYGWWLGSLKEDEDLGAKATPQQRYRSFIRKSLRKGNLDVLGRARYGRDDLERVLGHLEFERLRDGHTQLRSGDFRADPTWDRRALDGSVVSDCTSQDPGQSRCPEPPVCLAESGEEIPLKQRSLEEVRRCSSWATAIKDLGERVAPASPATSLYPGFVPRYAGSQFQFTRNDLAQLLSAYFSAIASNRASPAGAAAVFRRLPAGDSGRVAYRDAAEAFRTLHIFRADRDHDGRLRDREIYALVSGCPDLSFAARGPLRIKGLTGRQLEERSSFESFLDAQRVDASMPTLRFQSLTPPGSLFSSGPTTATTPADGGVAACKANSAFPEARAYLASLADTGLKQAYAEGVPVDDDPKKLEGLLRSLGRFPARAPGATLRDYVTAHANKQSWQLNEWAKRNAVDPDGADGTTISLNSLSLFLQSHEDLTADASILGSGTLTGRGTLLRGKRIRTGEKIARYRGVSSTVLRTAKDLEGEDANSPAIARLSRIAGGSSKREHSFALSLDFFGQRDVTDDPRWRVGWMAQRIDPTGTFTKRFTYLVQRRVLLRELDLDRHPVGIRKVEVGWALDRSLVVSTGETRKRRYFVTVTPEFRLPFFGRSLASNRFGADGRGLAPFASFGFEYNDVYRSPTAVDSALDHPFYVGSLGLKSVGKAVDATYAISGRTASDDSDLHLTYESATLAFKFRHKDRFSITLNYQQGRDGKVDEDVEQFIAAIGVKF